MRLERFIKVLVLLGLAATLAVPTAASANGDADNDGIADEIDTVTNTGTNVALGKTTSQSSTLDSRFPPENAVDGATGGDYTAGFTHTNDDEPWWDVDLGRHQTINGINIFNRTNCCGERLSGAVVMVGAHPFGNITLAEAEATSVWSTTIETATALMQIEVPERIGRYVRVQLPSSGSNALQLAEVQVMGFQGRFNDADADFVIDAEDTIDNNGVIVSTEQPATQSSISTIRDDAGPDAAVDGTREGGRDGTFPIALTDDDEPWWEVDLGAWYSVDGVNLYNRTDAGNEHLIVGAELLIGEQPFGDISLAAAQAQAAWSTTITESTRIIQVDLPEAVGRYVRVQLPPGAGNQLGLGEVDVIASSDPQTGDLDNDTIPNGSDLYVTGANVALSKATAQSSNWSSEFPPSKAVDGLTGGDRTSGFSHTRDGSPWWDVDLGANFTIDNINIFNRTDCCGDRLADAEVMISIAPFGDITIEQARDRAAWVGTIGSVPGVITQFGVPDAIGRYVRVQLPDNGEQALQLAEVQVSGIEYFGSVGNGDPAGDEDGDTIINIDDTVITGTNVAFEKPATQSSNYDSTFVAAKAVDGLTGGGYTDSFTHTLDDEPWWDVDLGADFTIDNINIFNRTNCCGSRLTDAVVMISSQPFGEMPIGTAIAQSAWTVTIENPAAIMQYVVPDVVGRYVRVQIPSGLANALSLAEVQVSGIAAS